MKPLTSWICDSCGDAIVDTRMALLVFKSGEDVMYHSFRIVHKGRACDDRAYSMSIQLNELLGLHGQARLLALLTAGPLKPPPSDPSFPRVDLGEFVDVFRRLQTPWYEEARQFFGHPDVESDWSDANEVLPYLPESLRDIALEHMESDG